MIQERKPTLVSHLKDLICLECEYSPGPGAEWTAKIEFRPLKYGYSVWWGGSSDGDPASKPERIDKVVQPLTLREAARWLRSTPDYRLGGNFFAEVSVHGISGCNAHILAMCWCYDDQNPVEDILEFLLRLDDDEIEYLWGWHQHPLSEEAMSNLRELMNVLENLCSIGQSLKALFNIPTVLDLPTPDRLLLNLRQRLEDLEDGIREAVFDHNASMVATTLRYLWRSLPTSSETTKIGELVSKCKVVVSFLKSETSETDNVPQGLHHISSLGDVTLEEMSPKDLMKEVPIDSTRVQQTLECLSICNISVRDSQVKSDLMAVWAQLAEKPQLPSEAPKRTRRTKESKWLQWLTGDHIHNSLESIKPIDDYILQGLIEWAKESADDLRQIIATPIRHTAASGGAWGAAIAAGERKVDKMTLEFCEEILNVVGSRFLK